MRKKTNTEKQANHNIFQQSTKKINHQQVLTKPENHLYEELKFTIELQHHLSGKSFSDSVGKKKHFVGNEKKRGQTPKNVSDPFCRRVCFLFGGAAAVSICVTGAAGAVLISPAIVAVYLILFICLPSPSGGRPLQAGHTFFFFFISSHLLSGLFLVGESGSYPL